MLLAGDERRHNNPDKAYVDAEFLRGGCRVTANLTTLLTDFTSKADQLKENVTTVYVVSEQIVYRLKSIANISSLPNGWKKETVDLTAVNNRLDAVEANKANVTDVTAADSAVITQLIGTAPANASTLGKLYTMLQGLQALINGDDLNLDSIKELADAVKAEQLTIDALTGNKLNKTDIYNALDYAIGGKALDARQGKALNDLLAVNATAIATETIARKTASAGKRDKLEAFYTMQTASFTLAADMVDKVVVCSHAAVAIVATIVDDSLFAIGACFEIRQSGMAGVILTTVNGIALNAPQGLVLSRRYSYMQVVKQANNTYNVSIIGDDPTKVDKIDNYSLMANQEITRLAGIKKEIHWCIMSPMREVKDRFINAAQIIQIYIDGTTPYFQYSFNNGASYATVAVPLAAPIDIPANTVARWRIAFASSTSLAEVTLVLA